VIEHDWTTDQMDASKGMESLIRGPYKLLSSKDENPLCSGILFCVTFQLMKPTDALKQYVSLRDSILAEREQLITRLREMDEALGAMGLRGKDSYYGPRTPSGRVRNELSLKEAVLKVIESKPLTKHEILDAVMALGYQFSTDDPLNSLGVILYGKNPRFKNDQGKFSLK
jgi:hypothetical protein